MHKTEHGPSSKANIRNLDMSFWVSQNMKIDEEDETKEKIREKVEEQLRVEGEEGKNIRKFSAFPGGTDEGT
jgi:hypothetical protein